jgi:hypothetical protein
MLHGSKESRMFQFLTKFGGRATMFCFVFGKDRPHKLLRHKPRFLRSLLVEELESRTLMSGVTSIGLLPGPIRLLPPNTLNDGNFDTPGLAANTYQYSPTGSPWQFSPVTGSSGGGVSTNGSAFTNGNPNAPTAQVAFLQVNGSISQSVSFTPGSYSLWFLDAQRGNAQSSFQAINVLVDGKLLDAVVPSSTQYQAHQTGNFSITTKGTHTIQFQGVNPIGGNNTAFLTEVQIRSNVTVPSPTDPLGQAVMDFNSHGSITYNDMLGLFTMAEGPVTLTSTVTKSAMQCLQTVVADAAPFKMLDYVSNLASKVVNGNAANATCQTGPLGNLDPNGGSYSWLLQNLVYKWFMGQDYPATPNSTGGSNPTPIWYQATSGTLFGSGISYTDVRQGGVGDCWFVASLEETARVAPSIIQNMFIDNGNGSYTVRFFRGTVPDYVTVDSFLPVTGSDWNSAYLVYAHSLAGYDRAWDPSNKLWVALAEKAYAQVCAEGWNGRPTVNAYDSLDGGWPGPPMSHITGVACYDHGVFVYLPATLGQYFNSGYIVTFCTQGSPTVSNVVGNHCYALLAWNATTDQFTIGNPWGIDAQYNNQAAGVVTLTEAQLVACVDDYALSSVPLNFVPVPVGFNSAMATAIVPSPVTSAVGAKGSQEGPSFLLQSLDASLTGQASYLAAFSEIVRGYPGGDSESFGHAHRLQTFRIVDEVLADWEPRTWSAA